MDPKLHNYIKPKQQKQEEEEQTKTLYFYLQNIPATFEKPTQLFVDKKLQLTMTKHQQMNKIN